MRLLLLCYNLRIVHLNVYVIPHIGNCSLYKLHFINTVHVAICFNFMKALIFAKWNVSAYAVCQSLKGKEEASSQTFIYNTAIFLASSNGCYYHTIPAFIVMLVWMISTCKVRPRFPCSFKLYICKANLSPASTVTKIQTLLHFPDSNVTDMLFLKVLLSSRWYYFHSLLSLVCGRR